MFGSFCGKIINIPARTVTYPTYYSAIETWKMGSVFNNFFFDNPAIITIVQVYSRRQTLNRYYSNKVLWLGVTLEI